MDQSKLKRCSASSSSHAEAADEPTDPLQKDKRGLEDLETEDNSRKKQKQEEETTEKKKECCYDTKDAFGNNDRTIFVTGFDTGGSRAEIRSALAKHFSSCGELIRVFVPIECKTGVAIGHAFINLKESVGDIEAALSLNGSDLGGRKLLVTMAKRREEYYIRRRFKGCETCQAMFVASRWEMYKRIVKTGGGKVAFVPPEIEKKLRRLRKMAKSNTKG